MSDAPAMTPQQAKLVSEEISPFQAYRSLACEDGSTLFWLRFELATLMCANLPGILGFAARTLCYPPLFKSCGKRPAIGRGVILRNTKKIEIGRKLLLDDYACLDVHGAGGVLKIGDFVSVGRFSTIAAKGGEIIIGSGANIGSYCRIATQSRVEIGESVLVGGYAYIGAGNHQRAASDIPLISRDMEIKGGVTIGEHAWIGAQAMILDGVKIGKGAIIGAQAFVKEDVPAGALVAGTPARVVGEAGG